MCHDLRISTTLSICLLYVTAVFGSLTRFPRSNNVTVSLDGPNRADDFDSLVTARLQELKELWLHVQPVSIQVIPRPRASVSSDDFVGIRMWVLVPGPWREYVTTNGPFNEPGTSPAQWDEPEEMSILSHDPFPWQNHGLSLHEAFDLLLEEGLLTPFRVVFIARLTYAHLPAYQAYYSFAAADSQQVIQMGMLDGRIYRSSASDPAL